MTDDEIKIADIVLNQFIYGSPRSWSNDTLFNWIREEKERSDDDWLSNFLLMDQYRLYNKIRNFLLTENYIETDPGREDKDFLTKKGKIAKEVKGHSHYLRWQTKENRKKNIEWFIMYILLPIITLATLIVGIIQLSKSHN